jgi:hypothetical protein
MSCILDLISQIKRRYKSNFKMEVSVVEMSLQLRFENMILFVPRSFQMQCHKIGVFNPFTWSKAVITAAALIEHRNK